MTKTVKDLFDELEEVTYPTPPGIKDLVLGIDWASDPTPYGGHAVGFTATPTGRIVFITSEISPDYIGHVKQIFTKSRKSAMSLNFNQLYGIWTLFDLKEQDQREPPVTNWKKRTVPHLIAEQNRKHWKRR